MAKKNEEKEQLPTAAKDQALAPVGLEADELAGMYGDMDKEHFNVPRLTILEQMSPEVGQKLGDAGEFFIKGPNTRLGTKPLELVVLMRSHSRISWKKMEEGGGILCQAQDGKRGLGTPGGECASCPQKDWNGQEKPKCDLYENFVVVRREDLQHSAGEAQPMAISGARARLKDLKAFNNLLHPLMQRRLPLFAKSFFVSIVELPNPAVKNSVYRIFRFSPANDNQQLPPAEQKVAYELFKQFNGHVKIEQEAPAGSREVPDAPADAPKY